MIEEFISDPFKTVNAVRGCREFVRKQGNMLNKIIVDLCVEYYRGRCKKEMKEWIGAAKEFYMLEEKPIETNFEIQGLLHFGSREEYFEYYYRLENE